MSSNAVVLTIGLFAAFMFTGASLLAICGKTIKPKNSKSKPILYNDESYRMENSEPVKQDNRFSSVLQYFTFKPNRTSSEPKGLESITIPTENKRSTYLYANFE